ncbi:MAG: hypothetical protein HOE69_05260 [Euryarchaeota archaeon]|jgi:ribonuclease P protein subunit RPR2|nr:hypothetical protein [Euryarchaeota archaeon]
MARGRRGQARNAKRRRSRAIATRSHLETVLKEPWKHSNKTVNSAAKDILKLSQRHRLGLPNGRRSWVCRSCETALRPGVNARVRVRQGVWRITCLDCGIMIRRGPNFPKGE